MGSDLTIKQAQVGHPWNTLNDGYGAVPYSEGVRRAEVMPGGVPHIQGSHAVLHAIKSVGKLAAVFEELDHKDVAPAALHFNHRFGISDAQSETISAMSADLVTAALRLAHLYQFDLAEALERRAYEKNGVGIRGVEDMDKLHEERAQLKADLKRIAQERDLLRLRLDGVRDGLDDTLRESQAHRMAECNRAIRICMRAGVDEAVLDQLRSGEDV